MQVKCPFLLPFFNKKGGIWIFPYIMTPNFAAKIVMLGLSSKIFNFQYFYTRVDKYKIYRVELADLEMSLNLL